MGLSSITNSDGTSGAIGSGLGAGFDAAVTRRPPLPSSSPSSSRRDVALSGTSQPALSPPPVLPQRILVPPSDDDEIQTMGPRRNQPTSDAMEPGAIAETIRRALFGQGKDLAEVATELGLVKTDGHKSVPDEQRALSALDAAEGVTVTTDKSDVGVQHKITDARTGKTIVIIHDYETGEDYTRTVEGKGPAKGKESSRSVDGDGRTETGTYDPSSGIRSTHVMDRRAGTKTDITLSAAGPRHEITTASDGKRTETLTQDGISVITLPGGKVILRDEATGTEVTWEDLTLEEALARERKLNANIAAATEQLSDRQDELEVLEKTPENKRTEQQKLDVEIAGSKVAAAQSQVDKLQAEHYVLVTMYVASQTKPGSPEYRAAISDVLTAGHLRDRATANQRANQKAASTGEKLREANDDLAQFDIEQEALAAKRAEAPELFNEDGYSDPAVAAGGANDRGKLKQQKVFEKDGQLVLQNTYDNVNSDKDIIEEHPLTYVPGEPRKPSPGNPALEPPRSEAGKKVDRDWQVEWQKRPVADPSDIDFETARTQQKQAGRDYSNAKAEQAATRKVDVDAAIPDLRKAHNEAVKKYGPGRESLPQGPERARFVQIQKDGDLLWVHPEVAATYLALTQAEENSAALDAERQRQANERDRITFDQRWSTKIFGLETIAEDPFGSYDENVLWAEHPKTMRQMDRDLLAAQSHYADKWSDRWHTEKGLQEADITRWKYAHPNLAAQLHDVEGGAATESTEPAAANDATSQRDTLLAKPEFQAFADMQARLGKLEEEKESELDPYRRQIAIEGDRVAALQRLSIEELRDPEKRGTVRVELVTKNPDDFSQDAEKLQHELGGMFVGRNADEVKARVQAVANIMAKAGMPVDVDHVATQILRSPQINGDDPDTAGDLEITPIAMQYEAPKASMTTALFEVKNPAGRTFLVDMTGKVWEGGNFDEARNEFLDHNEMFQEEGVLLMPKNLDQVRLGSRSLQYDARAANNLTTGEKIERVAGTVLSVAALGIGLPGVNVIAAMGALYLAGATVQRQVSYLGHGGSWRDEQTLMNLLDLGANALPFGSTALRIRGLMRGGRMRTKDAWKAGLELNPWSSLTREAHELSSASILGKVGFAEMRWARGLDMASIALGAPTLLKSLHDVLVHWKDMSESERTQALIGLGSGAFGTAMGAYGLWKSRARAEDEVGQADPYPPYPDEAAEPDGGIQVHSFGSDGVYWPTSERVAHDPKSVGPDQPGELVVQGEVAGVRDDRDAGGAAGPQVTDTTVTEFYAGYANSKWNETSPVPWPPSPDGSGADVTEPTYASPRASAEAHGLARVLVVDFNDQGARAPHEVLTEELTGDPALMDAIRGGAPFAVNVSGHEGAARELGQQVADITGVTVLVPTRPDLATWKLVPPRPTPLESDGTMVLHADGTLVLTDTSGMGRVVAPEDHLGRLRGAGGHKAAFDMGDKVALLFGSSYLEGDAYSDPETFLSNRDRLVALGAPFVATVHGSFEVLGKRALLMTRYMASDRDIRQRVGDLGAQGQPLTRFAFDPSFFTPASLDSLAATRAFLAEKDVVIADMEFLIDAEGRFLLADYGDIMRNPMVGDIVLGELYESWRRRQFDYLDQLIGAARVAVGTAHPQAPAIAASLGTPSDSGTQSRVRSADAPDIMQLDLPDIPALVPPLSRAEEVRLLSVAEELRGRPTRTAGMGADYHPEGLGDAAVRRTAAETESPASPRMAFPWFRSGNLDDSASDQPAEDALNARWMAREAPFAAERLGLPRLLFDLEPDPDFHGTQISVRLPDNLDSVAEARISLGNTGVIKVGGISNGNQPEGTGAKLLAAALWLAHDVRGARPRTLVAPAFSDQRTLGSLSVYAERAKPGSWIAPIIGLVGGRTERINTPRSTDGQIYGVVADVSWEPGDGPRLPYDHDAHWRSQVDSAIGDPVRSRAILERFLKGDGLTGWLFRTSEPLRRLYREAVEQHGTRIIFGERGKRAFQEGNTVFIDADLTNDPYAFLFVLAHELSHAISYNRRQMNFALHRSPMTATPGRLLPLLGLQDGHGNYRDLAAMRREAIRHDVDVQLQEEGSANLQALQVRDDWRRAGAPARQVEQIFGLTPAIMRSYEQWRDGERSWTDASRTIGNSIAALPSPLGAGVTNRAHYEAQREKLWLELVGPVGSDHSIGADDRARANGMDEGTNPPPPPRMHYPSPGPREGGKEESSPIDPTVGKPSESIQPPATNTAATISVPDWVHREGVDASGLPVELKVPGWLATAITSSRDVPYVLVPKGGKESLERFVANDLEPTATPMQRQAIDTFRRQILPKIDDQKFMPRSMLDRIDAFLAGQARPGSDLPPSGFAYLAPPELQEPLARWYERNQAEPVVRWQNPLPLWNAERAHLASQRPAVTPEQVAAFRAAQGNASPAVELGGQCSAEAGRLKGALLAYGGITAASALTWRLLPPEWLPTVNAYAWALRGLGFSVQSAFPRATSGRYATLALTGLYATTFPPGIADGGVKMFDGVDPFVNGIFAAGTLPFAAQALQESTTRRTAPLSKWENHFGYGCYVLGSAVYATEAAATGGGAPPVIAGSLFTAGALKLWLDALRSKPARGVPIGLPSPPPSIPSRLALGVGFGGGLLLYSGMTLASELFEPEDEKGGATKLPGRVPEPSPTEVSPAHQLNLLGTADVQVRGSMYDVSLSADRDAAQEARAKND